MNLVIRAVLAGSGVVGLTFQTLTSHAQHRLRSDGRPAGGFYAAQALPHPHWKVFLFD